MRIKKKDEIHATNGFIVDSLDSDSSKDAPSVHAVNEAMGQIEVPGAQVWISNDVTIADILVALSYYIGTDETAGTVKLGNYEEWIAAGKPSMPTKSE